MMKKNIFVTIAAMALAVSAMHAQDLDPTVVVNRAYEGRLTDVHKPLQDMQVPDSVTSSLTEFAFDSSSIESHRLRIAREIERLSSSK